MKPGKVVEQIIQAPIGHGVGLAALKLHGSATDKVHWHRFSSSIGNVTGPHDGGRQHVVFSR